MSAITIAALKTQIANDIPDNNTRIVSPEKIRGVLINTIDSIVGAFGYADYQDSTYTELSPQAIPADTDVQILNDGVLGIKTYEPPGVTLYDTVNNVITGVNGETRLITVSLNIKPTSAGTTFFDMWFDIEGAVGKIYDRPQSFPKGDGVERPISNTTFAYTLDTWEANGAKLYIRANGTAEVYATRYVIGRSFART